MHFKNVNHWAHALYKKRLNTFTLLKDCTSLLHRQCLRGTTFAARWQQHSRDCADF